MHVRIIQSGPVTSYHEKFNDDNDSTIKSQGNRNFFSEDR